MEDLYVMPEYRGVYILSVSQSMIQNAELCSIDSLIPAFATGKGIGKALMATVAKVSIYIIYMSIYTYLYLYIILYYLDNFVISMIEQYGFNVKE